MIVGLMARMVSVTTPYPCCRSVKTAIDIWAQVSVAQFQCNFIYGH